MQHTIRIFLSSTFKDMLKERDYLVNSVFPALRTISEQRGIPFSWCDLRFGVASIENKEYVTWLCLKNIDTSSPCFVGILGDNYGSKPKNELKTGQIDQLSIFKGVPDMIKDDLGYTDIEMRYFLSVYANKDSFDFYFFKATSKIKGLSSNRKLWVDLLLHPFSYMKSIRDKAEDEQKNKNWKDFVKEHNGKNSPLYWHLYENKPFDKDLVYLTLKQEIEQKFTIPAWPKEELVFNEQKSYLGKILDKTLDVCEINSKSIVAEEKDITNLFCAKALGKTFYVANIINDAQKDGVLCLFYFIGVSHTIDTPLTIWKILYYQLCKYLNKDYSICYQINDIEKLRGEFLATLQQTQQKVLIVIDGYGRDEVVCTIEQYNTFIDSFPDPLDNVHYIITSQIDLPRSDRLSHIECKGFVNKKKFAVSYANKFYGISDKNFYGFDNVHTLDLRQIQFIIDEAVIKSFDSIIDLREKNIYTLIAERLLDHISQKNKLLEVKHDSFFVELKNALMFLSLSKYGLQESDICAICKITAEQWTIIYSYLYPFILSNGKIKIEKEISKCILINKNTDNYRLQLAKNMQSCNHKDIYTIEILHQLSIVNDKSSLLNFFSDIYVFDYVYTFDKFLLVEYLTAIENDGLLDQFKKLLKKSYMSKFGNSEPIKYYQKFICVFYDVFPRILTAIEYIEQADEYIKTHDVRNKVLLDYYLKKCDILITIGRTNDADITLGKIENLIQSDNSLLSKMPAFLKLKAYFYNNYLEEKEYRKLSVSYYKEILTYQVEDIDDLMFALYNLIYLSDNIQEVSIYIHKFQEILCNNNTIKKNSHPYMKYIFWNEEYSILAQKLNADSEEVNIIFGKLKTSLAKGISLYPYSHDICNNMFHLFEYMLEWYEKLKEKNIYEKFSYVVREMETILNEYIDKVKLIYSPLSLNYAYAMIEASRIYYDLAFINPLDKNNYLAKSLDYSISAEQTLTKIYNGNNLIIGEVFNNRASIFSDQLNYNMAIQAIEDAIRIKTDVGKVSGISMYDSKKTKIRILFEAVVHSTDIRQDSYLLKTCTDSINELKYEINNLYNFDYDIKEQCLSYLEKKEVQLQRCILDEKERICEKVYVLFEECKRTLMQIKYQRKDNNELSSLLVMYDKLKLFRQMYYDMESFIATHDVKSLITERCKDYEKETVSFAEIISKMSI